MCENSFEYRLALLSKLNDALRALNVAQERYLEHEADFVNNELLRLQKEYKDAAAALHHAVEQIE